MKTEEIKRLGSLLEKKDLDDNVRKSIEKRIVLIKEQKPIEK